VPLPKEQVERLFDAVTRPMLEPGERIVGAAFVVPGPSPASVGFVGAVVQSLRGQGDLWMSVTDRRVLFHRATFMSQKPKAFAWANPRSAVEVADTGERGGWSWLLYRKPDGDVMRLNFAVPWVDEFDAIVAALREPPAAAPQDWL
jgi:hypothetical protein